LLPTSIFVQERKMQMNVKNELAKKAENTGKVKLTKNMPIADMIKALEPCCQTAHCGRYIPHFDFGAKPSPIVPYRHLPQSLSGMTADCRSLV